VTAAAPVLRPDSPPLSERAVPALLCLLMVVDFAFSMAFESIPPGVRSAIAIPLYGGQAAFAVAALLFRPHPLCIRLFVIATLFLVPTYASQAAMLRVFGASSLVELAQFAVPMYVAVLMLAYGDRMPVRLLYYLAVGTGLFALAYGLTQPTYYHAGTEVNLDLVPGRFAPFHDNPHSTGYVLFACVIIVHQLMLSGLVRRIEAWCVMAFLFAVLVQFLSTQVIFSTIAYFLFHGLLVSGARVGSKLLVMLALAGGLALTLVLKEETNLEIRGESRINAEDLGSGRLGTWMDRLEMIERRDGAALIFGTGPGTDLFSSRTWRSKQTTSHQTFLTVTIEYGLLGLFLMVGFYGTLAAGLGRPVLALLGAIGVTCLVGNGVPLRPMPAILLWMALGVIVHRLSRERVP
jgi:O-antigen ligase